MEKKIKGVNIHNLEVEIKGHIDRGIVDLGALTLEVEDRDFILDIVSSYHEHTEGMFGGDITRITCDLEVDLDVFEDCKYNLTKEDLLNCEHNDLVRTLYVGGEEDFEVEQILFHFDVDGQDYTMKIDEE
jgi:hypothetical protein